MIAAPDRKKLAFQGATESLKLRLSLGTDKNRPVCVYDLAESLGVDVQFLPFDSFGGMYCKDQNLIMVPSRRPFGRQAFTCAHELGHWRFEHGTKADSYDELGQGGTNDPDELLADAFAAHLLMPKWAVQRAFRRREWPMDLISPEQVYTVSCQLGVGYESLLYQMCFSIDLISREQLERLRQASPKQIRSSVLGKNVGGRLVIADRHWESVAIDVEVDDYLILPTGSVLESDHVELIGEHEQGVLARPRKSGRCQAVSPPLKWSAFIRISRREYSGRSIFRHLEEPDEN